MTRLIKTSILLCSVGVISFIFIPHTTISALTAGVFIGASLMCAIIEEFIDYFSKDQ